jgi:hypothetical protein
MDPILYPVGQGAMDPFTQWVVDPTIYPMGQWIGVVDPTIQ